MANSEMVGKKFGMLTVIEDLGYNSHREGKVRCRCDCGKEIVAMSKRLRAGLTTNCGCSKKHRGYKDLSGQKFGRLTVIEFAGIKNHCATWRCMCECGNERIVSANNLKNGHTKSCGCYNRAIVHSLAKDLTGQKFNSWTVIRRVAYKSNRIMWHCKCECGNERDLSSGQLTSGHSKSCGCEKKKVLAQLRTTHGMRETRLYEIYQGVLKRCFNKNCHAYPLYGGAGVTVASEWLGTNGFENFVKWAFDNGYSDELTLDRYPNQKGNYEPSNCRWATMKQQNNNRKSNVYITRDGIIHTMSEWCDIFGLNYGTVNSRRQHGWSEDRLFDPPRKNRKE